MHERKLVDDIVRKAIHVAHEHNRVEAQTIRIEIGALNHAIPSTLRRLLEDAALGTVLEGAAFEIEKDLDTTSPTALDVRLVSIAVKGH